MNTLRYAVDLDQPNQPDGAVSRFSKMAHCCVLARISLRCGKTPHKLLSGYYIILESLQFEKWRQSHYYWNIA